MKRFYKYSISFISIAIVWMGYNVFKSEIIELKEQYLIKHNYFRNEEVFKRTIDDFKNYQNISIDFGEGGYMNASTSGFRYLKNDSINFRELYEHGEIGQLSLTDSTELLDYQNNEQQIVSFRINKSKIEIKLESNTVLNIDSYWVIDYKGNSKSDLFPELMNSLGLSDFKIEEIKKQLRQRNCFGFTNSSSKLILHFRSQQKTNPFVSSYSYCLFKDKELVDDFFDEIYYFGQLDDNSYWFFNDAIPIIDLLPGGYKNRDI